MALYVWHDVLEDYTSGIAFALARSRAEAWRVLERDDPVAARVVRESGAKPKRYDTARAFAIWGGG